MIQSGWIYIWFQLLALSIECLGTTHITVYEEQNTTLPCHHGLQNDNELQIHWYTPSSSFRSFAQCISGTRTYVDTRLKDRFSFVQQPRCTGDIRITHAQKQDETSYRCKVKRRGRLKEIIINVKVHDCPYPYVEDATWSETNLPKQTSVTYTCLSGYDLESGDLHRRCQANQTWSGMAPVCTKNDVETLRDLAKVEANDTNVESIAKNVTRLTSNPKLLNFAGVNHTSVILLHIVDINVSGFSEKVANYFMQTVSQILSANKSEVIKAQQAAGSSQRIIHAIERLPSKINMQNASHYTFEMPNVAVDVWNILNSSLPITGIATYSNFRRTLNSTNTSDEYNIARYFSESKIDYNTTNEVIFLSKRLVESYIKKVENTSSWRLSFLVYKTYVLFDRSSVTKSTGTAKVTAKYDPNRKRESETLTVTSNVVSVSISKGPQTVHIRNRQPLVFMAFTIPKEILHRYAHWKKKTISCVYWDVSLNKGKGNWSSRGCTYTGRHADISTLHTCQCNHLTNFAVLVNLNRETLTHHKLALSAISILGIALSSPCLLFTVLIIVATLVLPTESKKTDSRGKKALCNLALTLL